MSEQMRAVKLEKRPYRLGKRADQQAETRQRIVEAAVDLHGTIGPARTTMSQLAERAGVQRHTLYAHFPDERSVALACSGLFIERNPLPDPRQWIGLAPDARLREGLGALYRWYARTEGINACVLRDAEYHDLTREMAELRVGASMRAIGEVLGAGLDPAQQALLGLMMSFHSWRTLARDQGLDGEAAVRIALRAILG